MSAMTLWPNAPASSSLNEKRFDVLSYSDKAAGHSGDIRATLERQGQIIGINDLHIAAHARAEGLVIVTNNAGEFDRVAGLRWKTGSTRQLANWKTAGCCEFTTLNPMP